MKLFKILSLLIFTGCSTSLFHRNANIVGKSSIAEDKAKAKIEAVQSGLDLMNVQRLDQIGQISYGTGLALDASNTPAAKQLNSRVQSLANPPTVEQLNAQHEKAVSNYMVIAGG